MTENWQIKEIDALIRASRRQRDRLKKLVLKIENLNAEIESAHHKATELGHFIEPLERPDSGNFGTR